MSTIQNTPQPKTPKVIRSIPTDNPPTKGCNYDINGYLPDLTQANVGLANAKKWFNASNSEGLHSKISKKFARNFDNFIAKIANLSDTTNLLVIEIGSNWVHSDNSYEIYWREGKGIKISRIPPEYSAKFFYHPHMFQTTMYKCQQK